MENIIYTVLLALHNIALVGCAAAPFYNLRLVNQRARFGPKLHYELDTVVEGAIQGLEPFCWSFMFILFATGIGFPLTHYLFHGDLRATSGIVAAALTLKLAFVFGMAGIAGVITLFVNPKIKEIFAGFAVGVAPDEQKLKSFFSLRARRKKLCKVCFVLAVLILLVSPILSIY